MLAQTEKNRTQNAKSEIIFNIMLKETPRVCKTFFKTQSTKMATNNSTA